MEAASGSRSSQSIQRTRSSSTDEHKSTESSCKLDLLFQAEALEEEFSKSKSPICAYKLKCLYQHLGHDDAASHWSDMAAKSPNCFPTLTNFLGLSHPDLPLFALHAGNNGHPGGLYAFALSLGQDHNLYSFYLQSAALGGYPEACYHFAKLIGPDHEHYSMCIQGLKIAANPSNSNYEFLALTWLQDLNSTIAKQPQIIVHVSVDSSSDESEVGNTSSTSSSDSKSMDKEVMSSIPQIANKDVANSNSNVRRVENRGQHRRGCTLF